MSISLIDLIAHLANTGLIEVTNVRGEFACNSSSSHSIVVIPEGDTVEDDSPDGGYHWDNFTLADSTSKVRYLAAMLANGDKGAQQLAAKVREDIEWHPDDSVDHESLLTWPRHADGTTNIEFAELLIGLIQHPRVIILGGNDNGGDHYLDGQYPAFEIADKNWKVRKDVQGSETWWVLFDDNDGTKLRIREADPFTTVIPEKSPQPELADVKLTDRCAYEKDCGFCYMGSTRQGKEGDPQRLMEIVSGLAASGIFEIAYGGGEPTLWPHLEELLTFTREVGVVPNFTTKNHTILTSNPELFENVGAVAFSVNDKKSLDRLTKAYRSAGYQAKRKTTVQVVPEICSTPLLQEIVEWADKEDIRLTFLGYKTTGRGNLFDGRIPRADGFWIDLVKPYPNLRVAIDTVLAEKSQEAMNKIGVPTWCYHTKEGKSSLYIDAVENKIGASSYVPATEMAPLTNVSGEALTEEILTRFATY